MCSALPLGQLRPPCNIDMEIPEKVRSFSSPSVLRQWAFIGFSAILLLVWANPAHAGLVTDGTFEQTTLSSPGGYICTVAAGQYCTTSALTDWSVACPNGCTSSSGGTPLSLLFPGTGGIAFNGTNGLGSIADSPGGITSNIVADDGNSTYIYQAEIYQTISGLTVGSNYLLTFYQAGARQNGAGGTADEFWLVGLGSQQQSSADMTTAQDADTAWTQQNMTFNATSTSEVLFFLAESNDNGAPPVALLQDVSLTAATPEPRYLAFVSLGILGLMAAFRKRRRRA